MARETQGIAPGWYKDPADPTTQRWWDGDGWIGDPLPADATPPPGPPDPSARAGIPPAVIAPAELPPAETIPPAHPTPPDPTTGLPPAPARPGQPAPRPHGFPLATHGARMVARFVDIFLVFWLNVFVNGWFVYQFVNEMRPALAEVWRRAMAGERGTDNLPGTGDAESLLLIILVIATALWFAYEVPAVANTGQTPGKRMLRIKVVRMDSTQPVGFGRSFRRWYPMGLPTLFWSSGLGFLFQVLESAYALIDRPLRQALHDKVGRTAVVTLVAAKPHQPHQPAPPAPKEEQDAPADPS